MRGTGKEARGRRAMAQRLHSMTLLQGATALSRQLSSVPPGSEGNCRATPGSGVTRPWMGTEALRTDNMVWGFQGVHPAGTR